MTTAFVTNTIRRQNLEELNAILEPAFAANTQAHWIAKLATRRPVRSDQLAREALDWAIDMGMEPIFAEDDGYRSGTVRIDGEVITEGNARLDLTNTPMRSGRRSTPGQPFLNRDVEPGACVEASTASAAAARRTRLRQRTSTPHRQAR